LLINDDNDFYSRGKNKEIAMLFLSFGIVLAAVVVVGIIVLYRIHSYEKRIKKDSSKENH
jgi:hypothetical protein